MTIDARTEPRWVVISGGKGLAFLWHLDMEGATSFERGADRTGAVLLRLRRKNSTEAHIIVRVRATELAPKAEKILLARLETGDLP